MYPYRSEKEAEYTRIVNRVAELENEKLLEKIKPKKKHRPKIQKFDVVLVIIVLLIVIVEATTPNPKFLKGKQMAVQLEQVKNEPIWVRCLPKE